MTIVQEPPDVPKWVDTLDVGYQSLVDNVQRANRDFYNADKLLRSVVPNIYGLTGNFDQDTNYKNAQMVAAALYVKIGVELSLNGVIAEIPAQDLPEEFLPTDFKNFKDPHSFSPIKLYQYLFAKYAGNAAKTLVWGRMANAFAAHFGHGNWTWTHGNNDSDKFFALSFKQQNDHYTGYLSASVDVNALRPLANHICWKHDSRDAIQQALNDFADLLHLADRSPALVETARKVAKSVANAANGMSTAYGQKVNHAGDLIFTFRKERLEVRFSTALFDIIRSFLLTHHPDFSKHKEQA